MSATMFTGTATSMLDMRNKLKGHLTDASLGEHQWTVMKETPDELYLKGPGSPGISDDEFYINLKNDIDATSQKYCWEIRGAIGFNPNLTFYTQPGVTPAGCFFQLGSETTLSYWLSVNGRRFILVCKIGQFYLAMYNGYLLPYGTPDEQPYPLIVSGSASVRAAYTAISEYKTRNFWSPCSQNGDPDRFGTSSESDLNSSMYYYRPNKWVKCANPRSTYSSSTNRLRPSIWPNDITIAIGRSTSAEYTLLPLILNNNTGNSGIVPTGNMFGQFEDVYYTSGRLLTPESTITVGNETFICFPDHTYAGDSDFVALKMGTL